MPLRKKSLFDIVEAAFIWQFHKQAIRAGEPLSEPPAKQVAYYTKVVLYASHGQGQDSDNFSRKSEDIRTRRGCPSQLPEDFVSIRAIAADPRPQSPPSGE